MNDKKTVIQTHPVIGWDISTVDSYDAMMLRLHYLQDQSQSPEHVWLTTDVARQLIDILQAGIDKIESGEYYNQSDNIRH
ncbi:biofilm formation regulator BssS [Morganella morganii]|uniref:biofilm formation regulator BssS n=1 Tax=Morganella morganii TaxID=582 RepID=UPI003B254D74